MRAERAVGPDGGGDFRRILRTHTRVDVLAPVAEWPAVDAVFAARRDVVRHPVGSDPVTLIYRCPDPWQQAALRVGQRRVCAVGGSRQAENASATLSEIAADGTPDPATDALRRWICPLVEADTHLERPATVFYLPVSTAIGLARLANSRMPGNSASCRQAPTDVNKDLCHRGGGPGQRCIGSHVEAGRHRRNAFTDGYPLKRLP